MILVRASCSARAFFAKAKPAVALNLLFITLLIGERQTRAGPHEQARVGITGRMAALLAATLGGVLASTLVAHLTPSQVFAISAAATTLVALSAQRLLRAI